AVSLERPAHLAARCQGRAGVSRRRGARPAPCAARRRAARLSMRRSWLFVPGADAAAHAAAARSGADVIVLELEGFTPPDFRARARTGEPTVRDSARRAGRSAPAEQSATRRRGRAQRARTAPRTRSAEAKAMNRRQARREAPPRVTLVLGAPEVADGRPGGQPV